MGGEDDDGVVGNDGLVTPGFADPQSCVVERGDPAQFFMSMSISNNIELHHSIPRKYLTSPYVIT